jgi:putative ATPase
METSTNNSITIPLAERMRPQTLDDMVGQTKLVGKNGIIRQWLQNKTIPSMIFWGPPGVGKTTLAQMLAKIIGAEFYQLSAIQSGVKEVREVIALAKEHGKTGKRPVLFIDEIHRFSKSQQDSLLSAVEAGIITLIGATTENPSFEVISALLSRCQVIVLEPLYEEELLQLLYKALKSDQWLKNYTIQLTETDALLRYSGGDARKLLNLLEMVVMLSNTSEVDITNEKVSQILSKNLALYDKSGEMHYDIISAFIKSMRGSDPNAAVYWLARMIEGGEDPQFIARRMLIFASEDIGNANPNALLLAQSCFQSVSVIGYPECDLILSQTAIYLATSVKSNSSYKAIQAARQMVREKGDLPVPLHLRNAPTKLMKNLNYGADYQYAHDFENNFVELEYLPEAIKGSLFYSPQNNKKEQEIRQWLNLRWKGKYGAY